MKHRHALPCFAATMVLLLMAGRGALAADPVPDWTVPLGYANSMEVYAVVTVGTTTVDADGSMLAAFKGDDLRGVAEPTLSPAGKIFVLQVFSNADSESGLTYKVYDAATSLIHDIREGLTFVSNGAIGGISAPVSLSARVPPTASIGDAELVEGDSGTSSMIFTVTLSSPAEEVVTIAYASVSGTAIAGEDFIAVNDVVSFAIAETEATIAMPIIGDRLDEGHESFRVILTDPVGATLVVAEAVGTILDDDTPRLSVADVQADEGDTGITAAVFAVTMDIPSVFTITVDYATVAETATVGVDFIATEGSLVFSPGEQAKTVPANVIGDLVDEANEGFLLQLAGAQGAEITDGIGIATILDDDTAMVSIASGGQVTEGDDGLTAVKLSVTLNLESSFTVIVDWSTQAGTAAADVDFVSAGGQLSFAPGETEKSIAVQAMGDEVDELDESFTVVLSDARNALLGPAIATITVLDDDVAALSIGDLAVEEGDSGSRQVAMAVSLSKASDRTVTVDYASTEGSAKAGVDFSLTPGTLTFLPGERSRDILVTIHGNKLDEADKSLTVELSGANQATISQAAGTLVIMDDDNSLLSIGDAAIAEGDAGVTQMTFTVTLDYPSSFTVTCAWETAPETATAGVDYESAGGTLTFPPGQLSRTISVGIIGDAVDEDDESFTISLMNAEQAGMQDDQATGTIEDDDTSVFFMADMQVGEAAGIAMVRAVLSTPSARELWFRIAHQGGSATVDVDFEFAPIGLTFTPGETEKSFPVTILDDELPEGSEDLILVVTHISGTTLPDDADAVITILDDDSPDASITDVQQAEGDIGVAEMLFSVILDQPSPLTITIDYATADGTAVAGMDYEERSGKLVFAPGQIVQTMTVPILGDRVDELDKSFTVTLTNPVHVNLPATAATGTILDDDTASVAVTGAVVTEGDAGVSAVALAVALDIESSFTVTVDYRTEADTATEGIDYEAASGSLTFAPGEMAKEVLLTIHGDVVDELDENFALVLSNVQNALPGDLRGVVTILDDDNAMLSIGDDQVMETGGQAVVDVTLSTPCDREVTVTVTTADGSATAPSDYLAMNTLVSFAAGVTSRQVSVTIVDDEEVEGEQFFLVTLSGAQNAELSDGSATVTIVDDDVPVVNVGDGAVVEGGSIVFTLSLDRPSPFASSIGWITVDGSALAGLDYVAGGGSVSFAPYQMTVTLSVQTLEDELDEPDESFSVNLSMPLLLSVGDGEGTGTIIDNDEPWLRLTLAAATIGENGGSTIATVTRNTDTGVALVVELSSSDTGEATVPSSVSMAVGSSTATFMVSGVDEDIIDAHKQVTISATAVDHQSAQAVVTVLNDDQAENLVYSFSVRGDSYGGVTTGVTGAGYMVLDQRDGNAAAVVRWQDGRGERIDFSRDGGMWYMAGLAGSNLWVLNLTRIGLTPASVEEFSYLHMIGTAYTSDAPLGGGVVGRPVLSFQGPWRAGDPAGNPTTVQMGEASARLDYARTVLENTENTPFEQLLAELAASANVILVGSMEAISEAAGPRVAGQGVVCYNLNWNGVTGGNNGLRNFAYVGYLLLDLATGEMRILRAWREGSTWMYTVESWYGEQSFSYPLAVGNSSYAFLGARQEMIDRAEGEGDSHSFRFMYGATRSMLIGLPSKVPQTIALSLSGNLWSHSVDGGTGLYSQSTITCGVNGYTLAMNQQSMTMDAAMTFLESKMTGYQRR